jgi:hypothetical protein
MPVERAALLGSRGWAAEETIRTARRPRQGAPRRRAVTRPPTSFGHQTTSAASRPLRFARNGLAIATISPHWIAEGTPAETRGCTESTASTADASQTRLDLSTVLQTCQCPPRPPHRVIPRNFRHPIAYAPPIGAGSDGLVIRRSCSVRRGLRDRVPRPLTTPRAATKIGLHPVAAGGLR